MKYKHHHVKSHLSKDPFIDIDYCVLSGSCGSYQVLASGTYSDLFANKLY